MSNSMSEQPEVDQSVASHRPAWRSGGAITLFALVAIGGLTLDLWSKHWAFHTLGQDGHWVILPHVLEFQTMFNKGALFGIGKGQTGLFLAASAFALLLVSWMFVRSDARRWLMHVALAGILAGALGNMYDRVFVKLRVYEIQGRPMYLQELPGEGGDSVLHEYPPGRPNGYSIPLPAERSTELDPAVGAVRDFIKIPTKLWREQELWPWVFNVADMLLVGGVGILAIFLWRDGDTQRVAAGAEAGGSGGDSEKPGEGEVVEPVAASTSGSEPGV
jgi:signal peptidase II